MKIHENNTLGKLGAAIGKGLLAGMAATAAMTLSQMIEMKITKREPSDATVKVAEDTAGFKPASKEDKQLLSQEIHWSYGTAWGVARGLMGLTGLKGLPANLLHFGAVWGTALVMLPKHDAAKPINEQNPKDIAIDVLHHLCFNRRPCLRCIGCRQPPRTQSEKDYGNLKRLETPIKIS
ncbi:hypothetical protein ACFQZI_08470 [Mucilaginibacter lutimaris]|uniref:DUF1440 domain-containing protein n=1 Tax=Mucilaginibacter lutimaris TaxID=931629 RepID=A0ABW2ZFA4_9SPHI